MNRDLTVLTVLLLMLFLEGVGAWHFFPTMSDGEWVKSDAVTAAVSMIALSGAILYFSVLLVRRIASRIY